MNTSSELNYVNDFDPFADRYLDEVNTITLEKPKLEHQFEIETQKETTQPPLTAKEIKEAEAKAARELKELEILKANEIKAREAKILKELKEKEKKEAKEAKDKEIQTAKESKSMEDSIELRYTKSVQQDENLAVWRNKDFQALYEWKKNHWEKQGKTDGKVKAFQWLKKNAPNKTSAAMSEKCYESGLLDANKLPQKPRATIIPLRDGWILADEFGNYVNIEPDKNMGITYLINADLNADRGIYIPKPLPEESHFAKFLNSSLPDKEVQALVQEFSGSTLLGDTRFQKAMVNVGGGSNGKSVFLEIISALHEKIASMRLANLEGFGLSNLIDTSLAIAAEAPTKGINEEILKACITGDMVSVEGKFKDIIDYKPTAKWIIACNRFPKIADESKGLWRRLFIIEWKVEIEEGSKDQIRNLSQIIIEQELTIFLNWCLEGLTRLMQRGKFNPPESVLAAIKNEKTVNNNVISFAEDSCLKLSTTTEIKKDVIYDKYKEYCIEKNISVFGPPQFWSRMKAIFGDKNIVETRRLVKITLSDVGKESGKEVRIQKLYVNLVYGG